jgi:hypothetical protein
MDSYGLNIHIMAHPRVMMDTNASFMVGRIYRDARGGCNIGKSGIYGKGDHQNQR